MMKEKMKNKSIVFWIFTGIAIACLILSPILAYCFRNILIGGLLLGGSIIGWLGMIVADEIGKRDEREDSKRTNS